MMTCWEAQERMQRLLDGEDLPPLALFEAHLGGCRDCQSMHADVLWLQDVLARRPAPTAPEHLCTRIVAAVLEDRRTQHRLRHQVVKRLALAASVLLLLLAAVLAPRAPRPASATPLAVRTTRPATPAEPIPTLRDLASEAGSVVASLTRRTADGTVDQTRPLLEVVAGPVKQDLEVPAPFDSSTSSLQGAREGVSAGLEPVATSARRAWNLFLRELPPVDREGQGGL